MSEVATFRQMKNIAKGDLEDNEEFVMLKDYKDLKQELDKYKAKEKELREYLKYETEYGLWHIRGNEDKVKDTVENDILDILDKE